MDGTRSDPVQEVHLCQRRVELRDRHVGSHVLRREAVLGHDQSGCVYFALLYTVYSDYTSFKKVSENYNPHNRCRVFLLPHLNGSIQSWQKQEMVLR